MCGYFYSKKSLQVHYTIYSFQNAYYMICVYIYIYSQSTTSCDSNEGTKCLWTL